MSHPTVKNTKPTCEWECYNGGTNTQKTTFTWKLPQLDLLLRACPHEQCSTHYSATTVAPQSHHGFVSPSQLLVCCHKISTCKSRSPLLGRGPHAASIQKRSVTGPRDGIPHMYLCSSSAHRSFVRVATLAYISTRAIPKHNIIS